MRTQQDEFGPDRKYCPKCERFKRVEDFGKHANRPDGLQTWCRSCRRERDKERRGDIAKSTLEQLEQQTEIPESQWWEIEKQKRRAVRMLELADVEEEPRWRDPKIRERYVWAEIKRDSEHRGGDPQQIYADALRILNASLCESESPEEADDLVEDAIKRAIKRDIGRRFAGW